MTCRVVKYATLLLALLWSVGRAETISHGRFQELQVYRPPADARQVVLLLSDESGWNAELAGMALGLSNAGSFVVGIDLRELFGELERDDGDCVFPDGDLENLSHFVQAYYRLPGYRQPVLVGLGTGASFAYAMVAQAPDDTFAGAVSIDFCPELKLKKPLCESGSLRAQEDPSSTRLEPAPKLVTPWLALQRRTDGSCGAAVTRRFAVAGAMVELRGPAARNLVPPLQKAVEKLAASADDASSLPEEMKDLPIVEVRTSRPGDTLAILISGDGGWAGIDKALAAQLSARGIPVVGLDSLRYFWRERTPATTAADIDLIIQHYLMAWDKQDVLLIGYSQGADVLPFIVNRLPKQTRARVHLAALLGLGETAVFEFHLANWLAADKEGLPIRPELEKMHVPALCVYGSDESDSLCPQVASSTLNAVELRGGHHFDGDYVHLADIIIDANERKTP